MISITVEAPWGKTIAITQSCKSHTGSLRDSILSKACSFTHEHDHIRQAARTSALTDRHDRLVLLAPATPLALAPGVTALVLVPLVATPLVAAVLSAGLTAPLVSASLSTGLAAGLSTRRSTSLSTSLSASLSTGGAVCARSGAVRGTVLRSSGGRRATGTVQLALDECEGVLAVLVSVALVSGLVAAVAAVRVGGIAVGLHLGAGLLPFC